MTEPVGHGPRGAIPANSHASKEAAQVAAAPREKAEKVIQGSATLIKAPWYKRAGRSMVADDASTIGEFVLMSIVVPAFKNLVRDVVVGGLDRTLFGPGTLAGGGMRGSQGGIRQKYNEMIRTGAVNDQSQRQISQQDRAIHNFDAIRMDSREEAVSVLNRMIDRIEKYGSATVGDLYDYCGITTSDYAALRWGWTNLLGSDVRQYRSSWMLDLPEPTVLRS